MIPGIQIRDRRCIDVDFDVDEDGEVGFPGDEVMLNRGGIISQTVAFPDPSFHFLFF